MEIKVGVGVEWTNENDDVERFGVVMTVPYPSQVPGFEGVMLVKCTTDTFHGDPRCLVPVEVTKLRPRHRLSACVHAPG